MMDVTYAMSPSKFINSNAYDLYDVLHDVDSITNQSNKMT